MVMGWIFTIICGVSIFCSFLTGQAAQLSAAVAAGAQAGVELSLVMAGSLCLWSGIGRLLDHIGLTDQLARLMRPILCRLFPSTKQDDELARYLSSNLCANLLGLGNAATPMGIHAAKRLKQGDSATDELCRLVVLNTASIQLIPANVAAVRGSLGCSTPFDILLPVWITSFCSAGLGLAMAGFLGKVCKP